MWQTLLVRLLLFAVQGQPYESREAGCPAPEDIYPCTCSVGRNQKGYLKCEQLSGDEEFKNIIQASKNFIFQEVLIRNSKLQYIPHELFEDVKMSQLMLDHLNLTNVYDQPPQPLEKLQILIIESIQVESGLVWEILQPLEIVELYVRKMPIRSVGTDFTQYVAENLISFYFNDTETETIEPGAFDKFTELKNLAFYKGSIQRLDRETFPTPFNVEYIGFEYQKLSEIKEGLFTDMPNLSILSLVGNQIESIPEKAFDSNYRFHFFYLDENPISCDCGLKWAILAEVPVSGSCASPQLLQGRRLNDLKKYDFSECIDSSN